MTDADVHFYFDPVCPFAWMTSKWVRMVRAQRDYTVRWRFISLRLLNAQVDYDEHFPPEYEAGHTAGLRLLRVAAATRAEHGNDGVDAFYAACGDHVFEREPVEGADGERRDSPQFVGAVLADAGLPTGLVDALYEESWDTVIQAETDEALSLTGKDVGTPILLFAADRTPVAFFGPVISRLPTPEQASELWDHVIGLARFGGFAELKRSLREVPQLPSFGGRPGEIGIQQDWYAGSRRLKK